MKKRKEISNYPEESTIKWEEDKPPASYPIPHDYIVQTTWGRGPNKHTVQ
ncbi:2722_t:CDS:2, partial [Cetraspora pellucida]